MATVEQTMMKVQRIMTGPMGLQVIVQEDRFRVRFRDASTYLQIKVVDWGEDDDGEPRSLVVVSSPILLEVPPSPELFEWVARNGGTRWFGHIEVFDVEESGTVNLIFAHTLLGDFIDQPELEHCMWGILGGADAWDDELQAKFGGNKTTDG